MLGFRGKLTAASQTKCSSIPQGDMAPDHDTSSRMCARQFGHSKNSENAEMANQRGYRHKHKGGRSARIGCPEPFKEELRAHYVVHHYPNLCVPLRLCHFPQPVTRIGFNTDLSLNVPSGCGDRGSRRLGRTTGGAFFRHEVSTANPCLCLRFIYG